MADFELPSFLQGQEPETVHKEMIEQIPNDIDMSEGGHPYNYTYPTAYITSKLVQFHLAEAIKLITPQYCQGYDDIAAYHGNSRGLNRKEAISATGTIEVTAEAGTIIPYGSIFSTLSVNNVPAIEFKTTDADITFEVEETKTINIEAVVPGTDGNVQANTIIVKANDITGISAVNNSQPTKNGMNEEDLDDFINRMVEFDRKQGESYIGNPSDYKRWAEDTDGVGSARVIPPTEDDGITTIVITNQDGYAADQSICANVYNKIMCPDPPSTDGTMTEGEITSTERLAPIGAYIQVITHTTKEITISASISIDTDETNLETATNDFYKAVKEYLLSAIDYIYVSQVGLLLLNVKGVIDCDITTLLINGQNSNIPIGYDEKYTINENGINLTII